MLKLEDLQVDTHVAGVEPSVPVKILYVKKAGDDAADVTYKLLDGRVLKKTLFRTDEAELSVASETRAWAFDAKPESFKLAAEAAEQLKEIEAELATNATMAKSISQLQADDTHLTGFERDAQDILRIGDRRNAERQTRLREEADRAPESHDRHRDHGVSNAFVASNIARAGGVDLRVLSGPDESTAARHSDIQRGSAEDCGRDGVSP